MTGARHAGARSGATLRPHRPAVSALWPLVAVLAASGCKPTSGDAGGFPREQTLYLGGRQWGEPASFNPLASAPDFPMTDRVMLMYEALFTFDAQTGKLVPLLAESYHVEGDVISVKLDPAARWSDGQPVTADDVRYTFELGRTYKALKVAPVLPYISAIRIPAGAGDPPRTLEFVLDPARRNPLVVLDALASFRIVPRHTIEPLLASVGGKLEEFDKLRFDEGAVHSGPYHLHSFSGEKIVLERNDGYWGNAARHGGELPAPRFIVHPIYKSNDHFSVALQQGRLDASTTFIPRIWLKKKKGVRAWYDEPPYFPPTGIPMLFVNVTRGALGDVHLRRAMGFAINYADIRELAVSGYSDPLRPGLVLPFGVEARFFSEPDAALYGTTYDLARARAELEAGGYLPVFGADGNLLETRDAHGARLPTVFIKSPTGWSDWESIVRIVVRSLRAVGIDARERFVDASLFWPAWITGDFDLLMNIPAPEASPSKPWSRFEAVLASRDWVPEGGKMYKNQGRFNDPHGPDHIARIDELLTAIPTLSREDELVRAYRELNRIVMEQQPVLPLFYRPEQFYEFSTRVWEGFPTAANPFLPPQLPGDGVGIEMLWALRPVARR
jgi:peptide/nickel transport system substrate-binding protein